MSKVPQWIVESLGEMVQLAMPVDGACERYERGCRGRLQSIQWGEQRIYVTILLDPNDETYEENVGLDAIEPIRQ